MTSCCALRVPSAHTFCSRRVQAHMFAIARDALTAVQAAHPEGGPPYVAAWAGAGGAGGAWPQAADGGAAAGQHDAAPPNRRAMVDVTSAAAAAADHKNHLECHRHQERNCQEQDDRH